jgi:hypothetical protein
VARRSRVVSFKCLVTDRTIWLVERERFEAVGFLEEILVHSTCDGAEWDNMVLVVALRDINTKKGV